MNQQVIVITGASSGFGALTARALARAGHIVSSRVELPVKLLDQRNSGGAMRRQ